MELEEPIRDLGEYGVTVSLHPEVRAGISVLVYPMGTTAEEFAESLRAQAEAAAAAEAEAAEAAEAEESESSEEEAEE